MQPSHPVLPDLFVVEVEQNLKPLKRPQARRTRQLGAIQASLTRETLWRQMIQTYHFGPKTDAEVAQLLQIERSTVNARRNELVALGKVEDTKRTRKNPKTGVENTLWGLTEKGRQP